MTRVLTILLTPLAAALVFLGNAISWWDRRKCR